MAMTETGAPDRRPPPPPADVADEDPSRPQPHHGPGRGDRATSPRSDRAVSHEVGKLLDSAVATPSTTTTSPRTSSTSRGVRRRGPTLKRWRPRARSRHPDPQAHDAPHDRRRPTRRVASRSCGALMPAPRSAPRARRRRPRAEGVSEAEGAPRPVSRTQRPTQSRRTRRRRRRRQLRSRRRRRPRRPSRPEDGEEVDEEGPTGQEDGQQVDDEEVDRRRRPRRPQEARKRHLRRRSGR